MKDTPLFSITKIVDDSTGIWAGDLCEYGIPVSSITSFLEAHGERGMREIETMTLHVLRHIRSNYMPVEKTCVAAAEDKQE